MLSAGLTPGRVLRVPSRGVLLSFVSCVLLACGGPGRPDAGLEDAGLTGGGTAAGGGGASGGGAGGGGMTGGGGSATGGGMQDAGSTGGGSASTFPIKHVIVIVKENHTFDNYFGSFPGAEGISEIQTSTERFPVPHAPDRTPRDLCHEYSCALTDLDGGAMNGWENVRGSSSNGDHLAWAQYFESDIPNYWAYARKYTLADHFFAGQLGPSFPGHTFVLAAQAGWANGNPNISYTHPFWGCDQAAATRVTIEDQATCSDKEVFPCFDIPSVPDILPQGIDWKFYGTNFYVFNEQWSMFNAIKSIRQGPGWLKIVNASQFDKDIDAKTLPEVTWLVNQDLNDEHPNVGSICQGENWTVQKINKVMQSDYCSLKT
jgi:phospholipase C